MSYICSNCGKENIVGRSQRHGRGVAGKRWIKRAPATPRMFKANLQKIAVWLSGKKETQLLCTKCIKRFVKEGKIK